MKLSILILTHNRPQLFQRCLLSVLSQLPPDVEVIVNNDSCDIVEVEHPAVTYHYNKFDNLSQIYQFLLGQAKGEHVYYLEDDDYLTHGFFNLPLDADLICGNYMPMYAPNNILEYALLYKDGMHGDAEQFLNSVSFWHLQLSQYIFRRRLADTFPFEMNSNHDNDAKLMKHVACKSATIRTTSKILFYQTTDGGDNISFPKQAATV